MLIRTHSLPRAPAGPPRTRLAGFTAVELLVVIAIAGILVALALPSFKDVITRHRVQRATEDLVATLYFARSEAMRRGGQVTLRKRLETGCNATTNQDWSCGWSVFFDANEDGTKNGTDVDLRTSGIPVGVDVMTTNASGPAAMTFDRWGHSSTVSGAVGFGFHLQRAGGTGSTSGNEKVVCISKSGRIRTLPDLTSCP